MEGAAPSTCGQGVKSYLQLCWSGEAFVHSCCCASSLPAQHRPTAQEDTEQPQVCAPLHAPAAGSGMRRHFHQTVIKSLF